MLQKLAILKVVTLVFELVLFYKSVDPAGYILVKILPAKGRCFKHWIVEVTGLKQPLVVVKNEACLAAQILYRRIPILIALNWIVLILAKKRDMGLARLSLNVYRLVVWVVG